MSVFNTGPNTSLSELISSVQSSCMHGRSERESLATCKLYHSIMLQSSVWMLKEVTLRLNAGYPAVSQQHFRRPRNTGDVGKNQLALSVWIWQLHFHISSSLGRGCSTASQVVLVPIDAFPPTAAVQFGLLRRAVIYISTFKSVERFEQPD